MVLQRSGKPGNVMGFFFHFTLYIVKAKVSLFKKYLNLQ